MNYVTLEKVMYKDRNNYEAEYNKRFNSDCTYKIPLYIEDFHHNEVQLFLYPTIELTNLLDKMWILNRKIYSRLDVLPVVAQQQYMRQCVIKEVRRTNEIEGVQSTKREIKEAMENSNANIQKKFEGMAKKYAFLMTGMDISLESIQDIRDLYDEIVAPEVESKNQLDGEIFRKDIVDVTNAMDQVIHQGVYPESKISTTLENALSFLKNDDIPEIFRIAIFHYYFGYIHPFYDGNGRTSRFISSYLLSKNMTKLLSCSLSNTIKDNIKKYEEGFKVVNNPRNKGDVTPFCIMFLEMITTAQIDIISNLDEKIEILDYYSEMIEEDKKLGKEYKSLLYILVQVYLFADEYGKTLTQLVGILNKTSYSIRKQLNYLVQHNYVIESKVSRANYYTFNLDCYDTEE